MNPESPRFVTTHWSVVLAAGGAKSSESRAALGALCQTYWYPLYAYARRRGQTTEEAEDSAQSFFAHLMSKNGLSRADPNRGRFRAYLLTSFKNFMSNEAARERAAKRGGGRTILSLNVDRSEQHLAAEPAHELTPERIFLRDWALTVVREVLQQLRESYDKRGKGALFDELKEYLTPNDSLPGYAERAAALGMREGALKVAVHRLRHRYRDALREAIAQTVRTPGELDDEIRDLIAAVNPL